jgi:sensor domain CHASE-containing protein
MDPTAFPAGPETRRRAADDAASDRPPARGPRRALARAVTLVPAAAALALILAAGAIAERVAEAHVRAETRARAEVAAAAARDRLDTAIAARMGALAALSDALAAAPCQPTEFAAVGDRLIGADPMLRALAGQAESGVALTAPAGGAHEAALARLVAPMGPQGPTARPLAAPGPPVALVAAGGPGPRTAAALDLSALYDAARPAEPAPFDIALLDTAGGGRQLLMGSPGVLAAGPVVAGLAPPAADWRIAVAPRDGWEGDIGPALGVRLATILVATAVVGSMLHARRRRADALPPSPT